MSLIQVGLVDKTKEINPDLLQSVAAALTIQVTRDLPQFWNVQASVSYLQNSAKIPAGVWPIFLVKSLPPGEGGFHMDKHNQPYAKVIASGANEEWTIDASHELVEMLVDPYGNRLQNSTSIEIVGSEIKDGTTESAYLVEACDPCEADNFGYAIQGVTVSDFITPHFYDPIFTTGTRYSFTGAITRPREVLRGGYITFVNQETDTVQQILYLGAKPELRDLGSAAGLSLREFVDNEMAAQHGKTTVRTAHGTFNKDLMARNAAKRGNLAKIAESRAKLYDVDPGKGKHARP